MKKQKYYEVNNGVYALIKACCRNKVVNIYKEFVSDSEVNVEFIELDEFSATTKFFHQCGYSKVSYGQALSMFEENDVLLLKGE